MRLRITFTKTGSLRYIGHLDLHSLWERTIRRAGLPLAYTQGFHPTPRIQLASALPLGFLGRAEIVDLWLEGDTPVVGMDNRVQAAAPPGLGITSIVQVDDHSPALQTQVFAADYEVTLLDPVDEATLALGLTDILSAASLPRERRGKAYDLRALIESLSIDRSAALEAEARPRILMRLSAREGATGRPEEVLAVLGIPAEATRIERTCLLLKDNQPSC